MKNKSELTSAQKWERATLADNFIFCKVMTANPDLCKELLELLLGIKIDRIEQPLAEHSLKTDYGSKGIRLDVYVKDGTGRCFDIEMQTTTRRDLARRARYYQGLMDIDGLDSGEYYGELKDSYIIFLCLDDPFDRGLPVYTFFTACEEDRSFSLDDGIHKIFYNAAKHAIMPSEELRSFFRFLAGTADESALSGRLAAMVEHAKTNGQWRQQFMTWEEEIRLREKEAAAEAFEEGAAQKAVETAKILLGKHVLTEIIVEATGLSPERVEQLQREAAVVES